jgi:hypothetical protein
MPHHVLIAFYDPVAMLQVELQFGLMYDTYRLRCYYYECVVLLEKCLLTMLLVLLQSQPAALQVLVAMAVIFIETVVHVSGTLAVDGSECFILSA